MKRFFFTLVLGGIIGAGIVWYFSGNNRQTVSRPASATNQTVADMKKSVSQTADSLRTEIDAKLDILHLKTDEIKKELEARGKVVRTQATQFASTVKDATRDARITTEIKGRFAMNKDVSALDISVNTTDGVVTLSGTASSYDSVSKAMLVAMEIDGVRQVVSTIQVKQ